jgi:hypothetical protein
MTRILQWLLSWALSKGGIAVRRVCGMLVMALVGHHIIPSGDASQIQNGLQSGEWLYSLLLTRVCSFGSTP